MCLSTVYMEGDQGMTEVMQNVAQIESQNSGFLLIGLLGEEKYVQGQIKRIDFLHQHSVVLNATAPERKG